MTGQSAFVFPSAQGRPAESQAASNAVNMRHGSSDEYASGERPHGLQHPGRTAAGQVHQMAQQPHHRTSNSPCDGAHQVAHKASQREDHSQHDAAHQVAHQARQRTSYSSQDDGGLKAASELASAENLDTYEDTAWEELESTGQLLLPDGQPWQAQTPGLNLGAGTGHVSEASSDVPDAGNHAGHAQAAADTEAAAAVGQDPSRSQPAASTTPEAAPSDTPDDSPKAVQIPPEHLGDGPAEGHDAPQLASPVTTSSLSPQPETNSAAVFPAHAHSAEDPEHAHAAARAEPGMDEGLSADDKASGHDNVDDSYPSASHGHPVNTASAMDDPAEEHPYVHSAAPANGHSKAQRAVVDKTAASQTEPALSSLDALPLVALHDRHSHRSDQPAVEDMASSRTDCEHKDDLPASDGLFTLSHGSGKGTGMSRQQDHAGTASDQPIEGLPADESHGPLQGSRQTENLRYAADWETESEASASPVKHQSSPD